jgi:hypothetical protein
MDIPQTAPLIAWAYLEDCPSLQTIRELLASVPDRDLLVRLRDMRGRGRNDYPVESLWGTLLLTVALRHTSIESCLAELQRNAGLRLLIGIVEADGVPKAWNMSRFLKNLGSPECLALAQEAFGHMVRRLGEAAPSLGVDAAGDSMGLSARRDRGEAPSALPQPSGGRKEYTDDSGKVTKVVEWFGYKLHLVVDVRHEVALAYRITSTKDGDGETLPELLEEAQDRLPEGRMKTLAYDRAADSEPFHSSLNDCGVSPVVEMRSLWKDNFDRPLPGRTDEPVRITYDEAGTVHCWDDSGTATVRRRMAYAGHEAKRRTLKYRCPAMTGEWTCGCERKCNAGKTYGLTVRVKQDIDLRRFPPIPRATLKFQRLYKGRTAVERVNGRIKIFWGADDGNIRGAHRFHAYVGAVMLVHMAFATILAGTARTPGTLGKMGLGPVQEALRRSG